MSRKVKIFNGTSDNSCKCDSWLNHWEKFSGLKADLCSEINCVKMEVVGTHVIKLNSDDRKCYIIPLCKEHSHLFQEIKIDNSVELVSANTNKTCAKS